MHPFFAALWTSLFIVIASPFTGVGTAYGIFVNPGCPDIATSESATNRTSVAINCKGFVAYAWVDDQTNTIQAAITRPGSQDCEPLGNALIQPDVMFSADAVRLRVGVDGDNNVYVSFFAKTLDDSAFAIKVSRYNTDGANPTWTDFSNGLPVATVNPLFLLSMAFNDAGDLALGWEEDIDASQNLFHGAVYNEPFGQWFTTDLLLNLIPTVKVVINSKGRAFFLIEDFNTNTNRSLLEGIVMDAAKSQTSPPVFPPLQMISDIRDTDLQRNSLSIDADGDAIAIWHNLNLTFEYNTYSSQTGVWGTSREPFVFSPIQLDLIQEMVLAVDQKSGNGAVVFSDLESITLFASAYNKSADTWTTPITLSDTIDGDFSISFAVDCRGTGIVIWRDFDFNTLLSTIRNVAFPNIREASLSDPQNLGIIFPQDTFEVSLASNLQCCKCDVRTSAALSKRLVGEQTILQSNFFYYIRKPADLCGEQFKDRFLLQETLVNKIIWSRGCAPEVPIIEYRVYRDKALTKRVATVRAGQKLIFVDENRKRGVTYTYYVVAIDANHNQSSPASIRVKPLTKKKAPLEAESLGLGD